MDAIEKCMNRLSTAMQKFTFAIDLRDSALISELHAHLRKMANNFDDIRQDIHTILFKIEGTRPLSDTLARQETPLKPEIFHTWSKVLRSYSCRKKLLASAFSAEAGPRMQSETEVFGFACRRRITSHWHQGAVSGWKPCLGALY